MPGPGAHKKDDGKLPVVKGFLWKFPRAIFGVTMVSVFGATKHEIPIGNTDVYDMEDCTGRLTEADGRHLIQEGEGLYDTESHYLHAAHHAWEAMARLESMMREGIPFKNPEK